MHVTMLALGSTGDILPIAALAKRLKEADHEVLFVTTADFTPNLQKMGLETMSVPGDARALINSSGAGTLALFRAFAEISRNLTAVLKPDDPILRQTDLILNQLPIGLYGWDLAERLGVPMVQAAVIPLTPTSEFPMMGWPTGSLNIGTYNRLSFRVYEKLTWLFMRSEINNWRHDTLQLDPRPLSRYWQDDGSVRPATIYGISPSVLPKPSDWGDGIYITGYWLPEDQGWQPSQNLTRFVEEGHKPIFVGFGSMPVKDRSDTLAQVLEAVRLTGKKAVLHTGYADLGSQDLPDNVFSVDYASYRWLLPRMEAIIHHGGSGTTGYSLWAGVPNLAVPFLFDQVFWGERVAHLGAGPKPIPFRKLTAARLASAIDRMVNDQPMIQLAQDLGTKIKAETGLDEACRILTSYSI